MKAEEQIKKHIACLPEAKGIEMLELHMLILKALPKCKLWFDDGKDKDNKTVANPTIGYGLFTIKYANGSTKEFFQIGLSANTTGISVYILGLKDKSYLAKTFGTMLGKAKVTGYCIKFKTMNDIHTDVLIEAVKYGVGATKDSTNHT